jgi:adenylate cyclase
MLALLASKWAPWWDEAGRQSFDYLSTAAPPLPDRPGAVIVAIDEPSFSAVGRPWPWPRDLHARLIRSLRAAGARTVVMDIVFAEPSDPAADAALAAASDARTVFAADESLTETEQGSMLIRTEPFPALLANGARAGVTAVSLDADAVARRISAYPDSLPRQMLLAGGQKPKADSEARLIQYFGPARSYPYVSYYQALDPDRLLPPGTFKGQDVIVGFALQATADVTAGTDMFETPFTRTTGQLTPGVEVQATVADNLLHGLSIRAAPAWTGFLLLLAGGALGFAVAAPASLTRNLLFAFAAAVAIVASSWLLLRFGRLFVSPAEPLVALAAAFTGLGVRDYAVERRRRREVQGAFSQYIAPAMVERLANNPELLKLGGERKCMTMLFTDVRGFTGISEAMKDDPEGLTRVINAILTPLSDIVIAHGGTIDKYMGDCVMAFWNAPLDDPDHARHAIQAGIAMVEAIADIDVAVKALLPDGSGAKPSVRIGVGVNSGECVVGNMGSAQRFDYTVLGDAVNVASRIEGLSKDYGVPMIVGETSVNMAGEGFRFVELGRIAVRGKTEPLGLFAVEGLDYPPAAG